MPASPCRTYTDPTEKAAWEALNRAETRLEEFLRTCEEDEVAKPQATGTGYFINKDNELMSAPLIKDSGIDKDQGIHRNDYEGLSAEDMTRIALSVNHWVSSREQASPLTPANYEQSFKQNGFEVISTGGGCTAWSKRLPAGRYLMVTDYDGMGHTFDDPQERILVGAYAPDSDPIGSVWHGPLAWAQVGIVEMTAAAIEDGLKALNQAGLVEEAINAAVKTIQNGLGVTHGDTAGIFFSGGEPHQKIKAALDEYVMTELKLLTPDFEVMDPPAQAQRSRHGNC
jgi:hypothetical protein